MDLWPSFIWRTQGYSSCSNLFTETWQKCSSSHDYKIISFSTYHQVMSMNGTSPKPMTKYAKGNVKYLDLWLVTFLTFHDHWKEPCIFQGQPPITGLPCPARQGEEDATLRRPSPSQLRSCKIPPCTPSASLPTIYLFIYTICTPPI